MPATNRGGVHNAPDFYETPDLLTVALIPHLQQYRRGRILEPTAANGAILRVLERAFPEAVIEHGDIRTGQDVFTHHYDGLYNLIHEDPHYSKALEFDSAALSLRAEHGRVAILLRLNFLCSQQQGAWRPPK
jgi:hypothetical protein